MKLIYDKKGNFKKKVLVYPRITSDGYLKYILSVNGQKCNVYAHRLIGMVFNNNDDIFQKTDCDHIDRNRWNNRPINLRWVTSLENQNNKGNYSAKINRKHDEKDIDYLEECISYLKGIDIKKKNVYLGSYNDDLELIRNEIKFEKEIENLKEIHDIKLLNKCFTRYKNETESKAKSYIEKDLEEKYEEESELLKTYCHDIPLLDKSLQKWKSDMK
jgi:hypothetical protein